MDVLLLNPYDENAVKNSLGFITPPLNLMYLAAALEKESFSVKIIDDDLLQRGYYKFAELAAKLNPRIIGVTATTSTIKTALNYLEAVKKILPESLTVIGGPHTTFMPLETLRDSNALDIVVLGEGEETLVDLANNYHPGENNERYLCKVMGIAYRDKNNWEKKKGNLKLTQPRPLIKNLDSLPFPARHLVPFESYGVSKNQSGGIVTSRGCVYSCGYCSSSLIMGKKFRSRSPDNVVDEIEELVYRYNIRDMAFMDDTFMLNKTRAHKIAYEIKARDLDVSFIASSRVDMVNKNLLSNLRNAGMNTLYYGVESGSQRVLNLMKKGITLKLAESAVKSAKKVGLDVLASFIIGYPGETEEEIDKTIDFSIKLNPDYSQYSILTPFPGTPIYHDLKNKGLIDTENWGKYTVMKPVLKYEKMGLTNKLVERKLAQAYLKFYTRPKYLLKHRHMLKVMIETLLRSFVLPKLQGNTVKGWYQNFENQSSSK
jgi:anaerobic magnesium-protoporphyrin IX monomethyl ester cyclase